MNDIEFIRDRVPQDALYDQLGEELAELAQAIYKLRRAEGNGNPTPVTVEEARAAVQEEISDVVNVAQVLELRIVANGNWIKGCKEKAAIFVIGDMLTDIAYSRPSLGHGFRGLMGALEKMGYELNGSEEKLRRWVERLEEKR